MFYTRSSGSTSCWPSSLHPCGSGQAITLFFTSYKLDPPYIKPASNRAEHNSDYHAQDTTKAQSFNVTIPFPVREQLSPPGHLEQPLSSYSPLILPFFWVERNEAPGEEARCLRVSPCIYRYHRADAPVEAGLMLKLQGTLEAFIPVFFLS